MRKHNRLPEFVALAVLAVLCNPDTAKAQTGLVATPNPVTFNVQTGVTPPSQNVNLTLNGASVSVQSVTATTTTGGQWLLPSVGSSSVFVSIQPSGLNAGTYNGTVTANTSAGSVSFQVNLTVAAAPTVNVSPSSLNFAFQTGTTAPLPQTITLTTSGTPANVSVSSSTNTGGTQWLIVTPTGQLTTPTQISVNIQPSGLSAGTTYTGNIQIVTSGGAANGTVNVPVSLLVSSNPIIAANPASLSFTAQVGTSAPAQNLSLTSSGNPLSYSVSSSVGSPPGGAWLQVPGQTGTTSGAISVSVNTAGLAVGTYIGAINVSAPNAGNGNLSIPVTLNITTGPALQLSAPTLAFAYQTGQAQPLSQTVSVSSTSGVSYTVASQTSTGGQWLSASPTSGVAPSNFVVSVNTTGLTPGSYTGSISVTPSGATSVPQTIQVTLVVSNNALLVLSPSNLTFTATVGSGGLQPQNVAVTSTDGTPVNYSVSTATATGLSWLLVNTSSATTPANLSISANQAGLAVGTYTGTVTITGPASVTNSPQAVHVTLNVTSNNTLNVSPSSLSFSQSTNGSAPPSQTVNVTSSGAGSGAQITFAASVAFNQGQNWLTVSPLNATTPAALTVTANGAGLASGTYTGAIILSSPGVANQTVNVTLTVGTGGGGGGLNFAGSLAQIASAGLWKTTFTMVNNGAAAAQVHINFYDDNGNPLALPLTFPQTSATPNPPATSLDRTINAGATVLVETTGPDNQATQVGWAQVSTNGTVGVFAVFRQAVNGAIPEAIVPLETRNAGSYVVAYDNTGGYATGVALANVASQSATINVIIRDDNGAILQTTSVVVPALGHTSFNLASRNPIADQRRGTLEFQTPAGGQISVLGLRFSPTTAFTTIPPLAK